MTKSMVPGARRDRLSRTEGAALIEEWRRSGLRPSAFAKARGVEAHRISYWRRQLEVAQPAPFVVMSSDELVSEAESATARVAEADAIEIVIGHRVVVRVRHTPSNLAGVLRELGGVVS